MKVTLWIIQIVLASALIGAILLQAKGQGLSGIFGQQTSVFRTKRGLEKTLFQGTIVLVVVFVGISLAIAKLGR